MTPEDQLEQWVCGISIHNDELGECCPDFSCCQPSLLASQEERDNFLVNKGMRDTMLMMFLSRMLTLQNYEVEYE